MKKILVSIIVPTYNVEKYLLQCLESINQQTYRAFECIIIIDGSKDQSYNIAKKYCEGHSQFSVYWQENAGSGPARNNGISHAKGSLIMFVDPDDWLKPELLEKLVNAQNEGDYDITTSRKQSFIDRNGQVTELRLSQYQPFNITNQKDLIEKHKRIISSGYCSAPTRTLYKTSIIRAHDVKFPSLRRSQDIVFNCRYCQYVHSFRTIQYTGYCYRIIPKEGIAKDRSQYYKTFKILYQEFSNLYINWNVVFDDVFFSTLLFERFFFSSLRLCVKQDIDIRPMLKDKDVYNIISRTHCSSIVLRLLTWLIKEKMFNLTILFIKITNYFKR